MVSTRGVGMSSPFIRSTVKESVGLLYVFRHIEERDDEFLGIVLRGTFNDAGKLVFVLRRIDSTSVP